MLQSIMVYAILLSVVSQFSSLPLEHSADAAPLRKQHILSEILEISADVPFVTSSINPKNPVTPFRQWDSNNGYCGEVSFIQAGMNQGMWMSQFNARLLCGTGIGQSGGANFCSSHNDESNYNAQFLIENPNPGDAPFASADLCLRNAHLAHSTYDYVNSPAGMPGYQRYLSWIKAQVIAGNQVTIGVLNNGGSDSQYDHEVSVTKIGTNHSVTDPSYFGDDVLYFDDHGSGGASFTSGYTFDSLAKTRDDANSLGAHSYSILIPGAFPVLSGSGGNGTDMNPHQLTASNVAFSVSGVVDPAHVTKPVRLTITASNTNGTANSAFGSDGLNFESPGLPNSCTESTPSAWMGMTLRADVSGLTSGQTYVLYEYDFSSVSGFGSAAALKVPDSNFNANASMATKATRFVANGQSYSQSIQTTSDKVIVFRCVAISAP
jgi:hypothetical protein